MNTNSDDILLLKLIKQGDQIAFRHLFYQYADSLNVLLLITSMTGKIARLGSGYFYLYMGKPAEL